MHHRGQQAVCSMVAGDVEYGNAGLLLALLKMADNLCSAFRRRSTDSRLKVEALLEVDVDDVISANSSVERIVSP
jgi:hypothetical protein